jgi:predicted RNase H-like HicB family nuclease
MVRKTHKISSYFAVFDPAEEGGYNVSLPDFPGCVTFGRTFEEAKEKAVEVLGLWIEEMAAQKQEIPKRNARPIIDEVRIAFS